MEDGARSRFGMLLRQFRLAAGLSQEALAESARTSVETIGALERGARRSPYRETVASLANALRLSAGDRTRLEGAGTRPQRLGRQRVVVAETREALPLQAPDPNDHISAPAAPLHNLPSELSSLIGREEATGDVSALVVAHRLVTLVGSGGVGKTRLALRVAENLLGSWPDGVWLVELAAVDKESLVAGAIAKTLGLQESSRRSPLETVVEAMRHKRALLVVDNCEHVIAEAGGIAVGVLRGCPNVSVLATSREPLHVDGERSFRVPSLDYPPERDIAVAQVAEFAAVRLFVDRARAAERAFSLNDENAPAIAEICRRLDGIPLAIELAAARVRMFAPRRLALMLDDRFRILSGGDRAAFPRLQTMRATIDWSFELLRESERVLARRLGIFVESWTLDAAQAVCSRAPLTGDDVLDLLASLVDKSLVTAEFSSGVARYSYLESIRAYALERLAAADECNRMARCHAEWAADYSEWHAVQEFTRGPSSAVIDYPEPTVHEAPNRQAALEWALAAGEASLAGRIAGSFVWAATSAADARRLTETALSQIRETQHVSIEARVWQTVSTMARGQPGFAAAQTAIGLFAQRGERSHWLVACLGTLLRACRSTGRLTEALEAADQLLALNQELGTADSYAHFHALVERAEVLKDLGRFQESRQGVIDAMAASSFGYHRLKAKNSLAELESDMGNVREAIAVAEDAAASVPKEQWSGLLSSGRSAISALRFNAAAYRLMLGDIEGARLASLDALELIPRWHSPVGRNVVIPSQHLATVAALRGDAQVAARLMGYVDAWYAAAGEVREPTEQRTYEILVTALKERLTDADIERLAAEGAQLDGDDVFDAALAISRTPVAPDERTTPCRSSKA